MISKQNNLQFLPYQADLSGERESKLYFLLLFIYFLSVFANVASQEISEIFSLQEIAKEIEQLEADCLIVFDVDEVLITTKDAFFHPKAEEFVLNLVKKEMALATTPEEQAKLEENLSLSFLEPERVLIEKSSPSTFERLTSKGQKGGSLNQFPDRKIWKIFRT